MGVRGGDGGSNCWSVLWLMSSNLYRCLRYVDMVDVCC